MSENSPISNAYQFFQQGEIEAAYETYRRLGSRKAEDDREWLMLGFLALEFNEPVRAIKALTKCLRSYADDPQAQLMMGLARRRTAKLEAAANSFRKALDLKPGWPDAVNNLAITLEDLQKYDQAIAVLEKGLLNSAEDADLLNALGSALVSAGRAEAALVHYRQAIALEPDFEPFKLNLAHALLHLRQWDEGWQLADSRLAFKNKQLFPESNAIPWQGESLSGKSILVWNEQGYGDMIQFSRFLPLLRNQSPAAIYLRIQPALLRLFQANFSELCEIFAFEDPLPESDFQIPMMSLPLYLSPNPFDVSGSAYLTAPAERLLELPADGTSVGLVWAGNPDHPEDHKRSLPVKYLRKLLKTNDITFVNLQVGAAGKTLRHSRLIHAAENINNFADTAAIIKNLDLVISVDTAVAHLGGALGVPTWLLLDYAGDWRWPRKGETSEWYDAIRIFRQQKPGDWKGVFNRVIEALAQHPGGSR